MYPSLRRRVIAVGYTPVDDAESAPPKLGMQVNGAAAGRTTPEECPSAMDVRGCCGTNKPETSLATTLRDRLFRG